MSVTMITYNMPPNRNMQSATKSKTAVHRGKSAAKSVPSTDTDAVAITGSSQPPCKACGVSGLWELVMVAVNSAYMIVNHSTNPASQKAIAIAGVLHNRRIWLPRMQVAATLVKKPGPRL